MSWRNIANNETTIVLLFGIIGISAVMVMDKFVDFFADNVWYKYLILGILGTVVLTSLSVVVRNGYRIRSRSNPANYNDVAE